MQALIFVLDALITLIVIAFLLRALFRWYAPTSATRSGRLCCA